MNVPAIALSLPAAMSMALPTSADHVVAVAAAARRPFTSRRIASAVPAIALRSHSTRSRTQVRSSPALS